MKTFALTAAAIIVAASGAIAGSGLVHLTGSADFKVTKGKYGNQIETKETRFFTGGPNEEHVFKVTTSLTHYFKVDGNIEKTEIEAYATKKNLYDTKAWTFKAEGVDFKFFGDSFVTVTRGGCCGSDDIDTMINIESGKQIVASVNQSAVEMEVPNSKLPKRYLAQVVDAKAPAKRGARTHIGTIGYFANNKVKGVARIYANLPAGWGASLTDLKMILKPQDSQRLQTVTLWSADGAKDLSAYNDVGIAGEIGYDTKLEKFSVVVDQDHISLTKSKVTSDLELEVINAK